VFSGLKYAALPLIASLSVLQRARGWLSRYLG
jgi:hypothetical protein